MKRMGKNFHPGSIWLHLQHSSDSGRRSDGLVAAAMPALVQAVTTSYMQDGKQVLELYICHALYDELTRNIRNSMKHDSWSHGMVNQVGHTMPFA